MKGFLFYRHDPFVLKNSAGTKVSREERQKKMKIYIDGACLKNPGGAGGWSFVLVENGRVLNTYSGHSPETTSNRMELTALIKALEHTNGDPTTILTDSKYVHLGVTKWMKGWKKNGWIAYYGDRHEVLNQDLWKTIDRLLSNRNNVTLCWIKGHNDNPYNELADQLANQKATEAQTNATIALQSLPYHSAELYAPPHIKATMEQIDNDN